VNNLIKLIESVSYGFNIFSKICLSAMVVLVGGNVILRMTPLGPIPGTFELTGYIGAILTSFALAHNQLIRGNICVEFIVGRFRIQTQAKIDASVSLVCSCLSALISWRSVIEAIEIHHSGEVSPTLSIPFFPILLGIATGFALLCLVFLIDAYRAVLEVRRR
jgi:TRAP-type C4-dicarboxylate transport system permease small subunit